MTARDGSWLSIAAALLALAACSDPPGGVSIDGGSVDAAVDAAAPGCGDGEVTGAEVCDGSSRACTELAGSYGDGMATCRADCTGWDVTACPDVSAGRFELVKPAARDPRWSGARCNDGTPFAFAVRRNAASSTWVIYLEGGVYCDDHSYGCGARATTFPALVTTLPGADRALGAGPTRGVLSSDVAVNPDFAGANQVFAHYCSSDFWIGATTDRRPTGAAPGGWYFSGRANVAALFETLQQRYGLDDARPDLRVLFMGSSAGAHGAHFNVRAAQERLPRTVGAGRLKLLLDAGWMFDWESPHITTTTVNDREVWRRALAFWGGRLDPACEAAAADDLDCWFGVGWWPHVATLVPTMLQQSRRDGSFGAMLHGTIDYAVWQTAAEASLRDVDRLWSGANVYHVLTDGDATWNSGPAGNTLRQTVGRFWAGGPPERILF